MLLELALGIIAIQTIVLVLILFRKGGIDSSVLHDLSESKSKVLREKAKIEAIISSMSDGIFAVNREGQVIIMNSVAETLSGFKIEEVKMKPHQEVFHFVFESHDGSSLVRVIEHVMQTGEIRDIKDHLLFTKKNGVQIHATASCAPIKDKEGEIIGCVMIFRDATSEHELERAKDDFLSIASHQLRTPLGSMRWNLEMLHNGDYGKLSPEIMDVLAESLESNSRMIELVNGLLSVSRIDQNRMRNLPQMVNVVEVISSAQREIQVAAEQRKINIIVDATPNPPPSIKVDPRLLFEVFENLLSNAVKYSAENEVVSIKVEVIGDNLQISIADKGIGIPKKDQPLLFSKFFRADNAILSETDGAGLGLFVVKSYVQILGGRVWVESPTHEEAKDGLVREYGTTFFVQFPIAKEKTS